MLEALFEYKYLQNAVLSAILASIACGIIGTIVIEKRLVMMSGGIAHTAFGGIGMGYFLGIEPIIGALIFSIAAAFGVATIKRKTGTNTDVPIGLFWSVGMSLGILFIAFTPGYPPDMSSYLFGDILTVSRSNLLVMLILDVVVVTTIIALFHPFKAYLFDEEFSTVVGIPTRFIEYLLFVLIALTVVVLIHVVGIILIIALLIAPPAIAKQFTRDLKSLMIYSSILGAALCFAGLWASYVFDLPSGAAIILLTGMVYAIVTGIGRIRINISKRTLENKSAKTAGH